jgi:HEAT repeat protein
MGDYVPPGPEIAEKIRAHSEEIKVLREELEALSDDEIRAIVGSDEPSLRRRAALSTLFQRIAGSASTDNERRRSQLVATCGNLLNDADDEVARLAIRHCPLTEDVHIEMVRAAMKRDDRHVKAEAAIKLARIGDATIFPTLLAWFNGSDEGLRNFAIGAMARLGTDEARKVLSEGYETAARGEAIGAARLVLRATYW